MHSNLVQNLRRVTAGALTLLVMVAPAVGAPIESGPTGPASGARQEQDAVPPRFATSVGMTRVKAAVIDADGEPIGGLGLEDFRIWENGVEQDITLVLDPVRFSLDVALVLDYSASIANDWSAKEARAAAHGFLDRLGSDDCVFLLPFNSNVGPGVWGQPDDVQVRQAVDEQAFELYTRLYDAVLLAHDALDRRRPDSASAAAEELEDTLYGTWMEPITGASCGEPLDPAEARERRAALVVLTDGADSGSRAAYSDALMASWRAEVPVFAMGVGMAAEGVRYRPSATSLRGRSAQARRSREQFEAISGLQDQLREIARVSGGQLVLQRDLADGYAATLGLLRGYYVLAYASPPEVREGWQEVEVELTAGSGDIVVQPGVYRGSDSHVGAVEILREASVKFTLGQYEEALLDFEHVARFTPDIGAPFFGRGLVLEKLERYDEAAASFTRSLELRPGAPATHAKLAAMAMHTGAHAVAWEHAIRAHVGGYAQVDTFEALQKVSDPPDNIRQRLVGPVVLFMRPRVAELDAQLALTEVSHYILAGLDSDPALAVTNEAAVATFSMNIWVRDLDDDGDLTARLVIHDLATGSRREQGFSIRDVGDPELVQTAVRDALEEARDWIVDRHDG
jgi:VWFA-related protein